MLAMPAAHALVQEMMRRRIVPTDVTERELSEAFKDSPGFAADVVQQCRSFRAVLLAADSPAALTSHPGLQQVCSCSACCFVLLCAPHVSVHVRHRHISWLFCAGQRERSACEARLCLKQLSPAWGIPP
jgi:hypothetical protein